MGVFADEFRAAVEACEDVPYPDGDYSGRGIVIPAGGWGMLPGVYLTASLLRWLDCKLPIEVWCIGDNGEYDHTMWHLTRHLGVTWKDASAALRERGVRRREKLRGWAVKPLLPLLSSFEQMIMLDADCYPVFDPERLWDHPAIGSKAAAFWPDNAVNPDGRALSGDQWAMFGMRVPYQANYGFEAGQMYVDKRRSWHAVQVAAWLSDRFQEFDKSRGKVGGFWGDKEVFNVAWSATRTPYHMAPPLTLHPVAFLQHEPDGHVAFVHRHHDKPRIDFQDLKAVKFAHTMYRATDLAHEQKVHEFLRELRHRMRPQVPGFRDGTQDVQVWQEVGVVNEYRLPPEMDGQVVLDVGGHIGLFSIECLKRGAELVVTVEPYEPNLLMTRQNLAPWTRNCRLIEKAVAALDGRKATMAGSTPHHTGEPHVTAAGPYAVETVSLDTLIDDCGGHVHLLKMDCEGSEYPALLACTKLDRVDRLVCEYHTKIDPLFEPNRRRLVEKLNAAGFDVETVEHNQWNGILHATRRDKPHGHHHAGHEVAPVPVVRDEAGWTETLQLVTPDSPWLVNDMAELPTWADVMPPVPKKLHQFWTGSRPMPEAFARWGRRWQELHPDWEYKLWTEAEVAALSPEVANALAGTPPGAGNPAGKSDVARVAIVLKFGGVWVDTDFEPVRPIDDVIVGLDCFMADNWGNTNMAVFGACADHPWMQASLKQIVTSAYRHPPPTVMMTAIHLGEAMGVKVLPKEMFYPYPAQRPENIYKPASTWPEAYAVHRHAMSWIPGHTLLPMYYKFKNRF
jgi:FkbM family methyltransferase